jgi:uncharacterized protein
MKPSEALRLKKEAVYAAVNRFQVINPRVFGSVLYGTDVEGSDIDILVDALPHTSLFDLGGLHTELESILGVPVDLLTPLDISAKFRDQIVADARPV